MKNQKKPPLRLSDRILSALELAIEQNDLLIAENLVRVLELSMTRKAGGISFKEKRAFPLKALKLIEQLNKLKH